VTGRLSGSSPEHPQGESRTSKHQPRGGTKMRAIKQPSTHQRLVVEMINAVEDRDVQEEMLAINKHYSQVLAGLRIAVNYLKEIDQDFGTDHSEMVAEISSLLKQSKASEMSLHEMAASTFEEAK